MTQGCKGLLTHGMVSTFQVNCNYKTKFSDSIISELIGQCACQYYLQESLDIMPVKLDSMQNFHALETFNPLTPRSDSQVSSPYDI